MPHQAHRDCTARCVFHQTGECREYVRAVRVVASLAGRSLWVRNGCPRPKPCPVRGFFSAGTGWLPDELGWFLPARSDSHFHLAQPDCFDAADICA